MVRNAHPAKPKNQHDPCTPNPESYFISRRPSRAFLSVTWSA